jgi:voltage-gated potassium channel Kch
MNGHAWPPLLPQPGATPEAVLTAIQRASFYQTGGAPLVPVFSKYKGYASARDLYPTVNYEAVPTALSDERPNFGAEIDTAPAPEEGIGRRAKVVSITDIEVTPETERSDELPSSTAKRRQTEISRRVSSGGTSYGGKMAAARVSRMEKAPKKEAEVKPTPFYERPEVLGLSVFILWFAVGYFAYTTMPWGPGSKPFSSVDAVYFQIQILTTVGYGDVVPHHFAGKLFTSVYVLVAIVMITAVVTQAVDQFLKSTKAKVNVKMGAGSEHAEHPGSKYVKLLLNVAFFLAVSAVGVVYALYFPEEFIKPNTNTNIGEEPEQNEIADAIYIVIITMTTVGFGDIYPRSNQGRIVMTVWMVAGVAATANLIGSLTDTLLKIKANLRLTELNSQLLEEIDTSGDGEVSKYEFLIFMLKKHDLVSDDTIMDIEENFDVLDKDGSGHLSSDDLKSMMTGS